MDVYFRCQCGRHLKAPSEFIGSRARCPYCGHVMTVAVEPQPAAPRPAGPHPAGAEFAQASPPTSVPEYLDPPKEPVEPKKKDKPSFSPRKMFEALLDPRSIQWMLTLGGGLAVLGLVIWLGSLGIFKNVMVLAVVMGIGTAAVLGIGWWMTLKTRYHVAGRALTMLGCLIAPLNLWFYHAQGLITLEGRLWIGGVVCCLVYVATVYVLRDPLFMYAVEGGVTLTVGLFLAELRLVSDTTYLSLFLLALGLLSIHAERAFPPEAECFTRRRFGMPLFWSGQSQVATALLILLGTQVVGWLAGPLREFLQFSWQGNLLTSNYLLAGGLWFAAAYAYLYSDIVVRRIGVYVYLAAVCVMLGTLTLSGLDVPHELLIAVLAAIGLGASLAQAGVATDDRLRRALPPAAFLMSILPVLLGIVLHIRATSLILAHTWHVDTGWTFVAVMVFVAACNRASAWYLRESKWSGAYLFLSAAALLVAAAGLLRGFGLSDWTVQAPWLMFIPIAYLVAARMWRGQGPEQILGWVAHAATAVILLGVVVSATEGNTLDTLIQPRHGQTANLRLGIVFVEAVLFYILAALVRRRSANVFLAAAAACGALWQFLGYGDVPLAYHTMIYAALGVALLAASRVQGISEEVVYGWTGSKSKAIQGPGRATFQAGNGVLCVALLAALLQGLIRLGVGHQDWLGAGALGLTILASLAASGLVPAGMWRRVYLTASVALVGLMFLVLNELVDLTIWQKFEIFATAVGLVLIALGYVGRFREGEGKDNDAVTVGLWLGSILSTLPLLIATIYYRAPGHDISRIDELALFAVSVLLVVTGYSWQFKSTTVFGGFALVIYLVMVIVSLAWRREVAVGVWLTVGGGLLFACGIALSIYRERLLKLPEQIARREGLFRVLDWR